ncbi:hypothetical protein EOM09_05505 [bacterium]|nr:hypothetical protein [bacterium]
MQNFEKTKIDILNKKDKSFKSSIDEKILNLCNIINEKKSLFTLSSCSGRICILECINKNNKKLSNWLIVDHFLANFEEFEKKLFEFSGENKLYFRQESAILHICVKDLELAEKIIIISKKSGFNKCSILSTKSKISVEIICALPLISPIYDKNILITKEYLKYLISEANEKQKYSWDCIKKLENEINLNFE